MISRAACGLQDEMDVDVEFGSSLLSCPCDQGRVQAAAMSAWLLQTGVGMATSRYVVAPFRSKTRSMRACSTWPLTTQVRAGMACAIHTSVPLCQWITPARHLVTAACLRSTPPPYRRSQICHRSNPLRCCGTPKERLRGLGLQGESPGHGHTKTTVFSLMGFAVGSQQVGSVGRRLRDEDGWSDRGCGVAFKDLFVKVLLDGGDKPVLGGGSVRSAGPSGLRRRKAGLFICCERVVL